MKIKRTIVMWIALGAQLVFAADIERQRNIETNCVCT